jgi:hypothetical protein
MQLPDTMLFLGAHGYMKTKLSHPLFTNASNTKIH